MTIPVFPDSQKAPPDPNYTLVFDEFFDLGLEESLSPFLTPKTRHLGVNLLLKISILSAVLLAFAFAFSWHPKTEALSDMLLVSVYFFAGTPALIEAIEDLTRFEINIDILMTLAAFSSVLIGSGMEGGLLLVLFAISGSMEEAVTAKAKSAISALHKLSPTKACVIEGGKLIERSVKEIDVGTTILVKSSQVVPLDGVVIEGISSVNLVHLTGESLPVTKKLGDQVPAGAQNMEGALTLRVTHTNADSTLSRIIQLVTQAQEARPSLQRWFDRMSRRYAIAIIFLAFLFAVTMPFMLGISFLGVEGSIYRALAFLIAASPCALIIAIPIAYLSAVSICARKGILMKGGVTLDALAACSAIAFDKTGTLTTGELSCECLEGLEAASPEEISEALAIAYAMEKNAVHPIARAICDYAQQQETKSKQLENFKAIPGYGLEAQVDATTKVYIGRPEYIMEMMASDQQQKLKMRLVEIEQQGELVAVELIGKKVFIFRFHDTVRPKIKETLQALKHKYHLQLLMLTGDHATNAQRVAQELGIDEYYADLKPEDKLNYVAKLSKEKKLAMIGDGVNDAPALARATVGICMGKVGSSTAIEAADVILLHDNIEYMDWLMNKALQTQRIVKQNLVLATGAIIIAALPALGGVIPLWLAVILHEGGTVLVGLNGLRLLFR